MARPAVGKCRKRTPDHSVLMMCHSAADRNPEGALSAPHFEGEPVSLEIDDSTPEADCHGVSPVIGAELQQNILDVALGAFL